MQHGRKIQYASLSDVGFRRRLNQDTFAVQIASDAKRWQEFGHLFLVADGMGGHAVGELASKIAAETVPHVYFKSTGESRGEALRDAIEQANHAIHERGTQNPDFLNMGTTCTAAVLGPDGVLFGHVGDSRGYRIRNGQIEQLTFDHSLQWELIRTGKLSAEEVQLRQPRNVITRSLGPSANVNVDIEGPFPVQEGDTYLLCSDGLPTHVSDEEIGIVAANLPVAEASRLLSHLANLRGGTDNTTVVIFRIGETTSQNVLIPQPEPLREKSAHSSNWWPLLAAWSVACFFAFGAMAYGFGHPDWGRNLIGLSALTGEAACLYWLRSRNQPQQPKSKPNQASSAPYQTAPAILTEEFLSVLTGLEQELQRTAEDEAWEIDWKRYNHAVQQAQSATEKLQLQQALDSLSVAVDVLMLGVHRFRRQRMLKKPPQKQPHD
ncbi:PP2C family protein-serine/threonine phosphatase [Thalassoroseus pseudoceratinae]|uniref:PP2C family protein-serine/threonine phosphatase n=1 Tax=Thalassoroseus pseudoceratinae TaxID=2713176 RepID=UPI00141E6030|nr:PP2C family serine/threonine-protein phosphatase [Thalassoroseus pseudoceratinae]